MSFESLDLSLPDDFDNVVRLFPLPNVVLFPGVLQGLHLFEPRYLEMLADAASDDNLISMAVIDENSIESISSTVPAIHSTICIGKIVTQAELEDGRFNILLAGSARAEIIKELDVDTPYRMAEVKVVNNRCDATEDQVAVVRKKLIDGFGKFAKTHQLASEPIRHILTNQLPFGLLVDLISHAIPGPMDKQVQVLECVDTFKRAKIVLAMLRDLVAMVPGEDSGHRSFPPPFSLN